MDRLLQQIQFIKEIDKLKEISRRSYLLSENRPENSAEHSWHITLMAILLLEHANEDVNVFRVVKMLLIHDIVEIDAGDTFCYDEKANLSKADKELIAAERIFGLLPNDQKTEMIDLWKEFESQGTREAKFAAALDRLMPLIHNLNTGGRAWKENGVVKNQVLKRNEHIKNGSTVLWNYVLAELNNAVKSGVLKESLKKTN